MGTELAKPKDAKTTIIELFDSRAESFAKIAAKGLDAKRAAKQAATAIVQNPDLLRCTPASLCMSVAQSVELGLDLAKAKGEAYLVPYGTTCQLIVGYQGWIRLMLESGVVASINSQCVYEGEEFEATFGTTIKIHHVPQFSVGRVLGAYAIARMTNGQDVAVMVREHDIERAMQASKAKTGPWKTDFDAMVRKTAVHRLRKLLPSSPVLDKAMDFDADSKWEAPARPEPAGPRNVSDIIGGGDEFNQTTDQPPENYEQSGPDFLKSLEQVPPADTLPGLKADSRKR